MKYALSIREHNIPAHLDIERDIQKKLNGQFTFTLRVNNANIVDYNVTEIVNVRTKYFALKSVVIQEFAISHIVGK